MGFSVRSIPTDVLLEKKNSPTQKTNQRSPQTIETTVSIAKLVMLY